MQPPADLLLPALLFTVIGIVIGVVAVLLIVDRTRARPDEKAPAEEPSQPAPAAPEEIPNLPADRFANVANFYRERATGRLAVEVEKMAYLTPDTVPAQIRQELLTLNEGLGIWLGATAAAVPPPVKSEPALPPVNLPPSPPPRVETPTSTSIVAQINDILQEILLESPMAERKISLTQEPSMGVVVWVDGVKYSGIDTVPDPAVKDLIKTAVRRWERKNDLSRRYP
jgi:hypothetical protein